MYLSSLRYNHGQHGQKQGRPRRLLRTGTRASKFQGGQDVDVLRSPDQDLKLTFKLLEGQRRQIISIYLWTSSFKSPLYMFWSGSRWNNLKQRQKPIISVDINVIKLVRKSMCAIFSLKEKFSVFFILFQLMTTNQFLSLIVTVTLRLNTSDFVLVLLVHKI